MTADTLIAEIKQAFSATRMPSDDELLHPDCMDDVDILEFYGGVEWQSLSDHQIVYSYAALTAFSALAFQYYLPAYLIWTLRNKDSVEYASESTLLALDPGTEKEMLHDFRKSKFSRLDQAQVAVIRKFLQTLLEHDDLGPLALSALENYWSEDASSVHFQ